MATATLPKAITYPTSDGKPMAESIYHVNLIVQILGLLTDYFETQPDVFVGGNSYVFYEEGDPKKRLSPDIYVAFGVTPKYRQSYRVWEEGKFPEFVMEFTSKKTRKNDMADKFNIYQDIWKVREYFLFDPEADFLKKSPTGFRLTNGVFQPIEMVNGRLNSDVLNFTFERKGHGLLLRDAETGAVITTRAETKLVEAEKEIELLKQQLAKLSSHSPNGH